MAGGPESQPVRPGKNPTSIPRNPIPAAQADRRPGAYTNPAKGAQGTGQTQRRTPEVCVPWSAVRAALLPPMAEGGEQGLSGTQRPWEQLAFEGSRSEGQREPGPR